MEHPRPLVNAVYYPSWKIYKGISPSTLPVAKISTVFYAFAIPNEDGTLKFLDEYADTKIPVDGQSGCLAALACLKQANPHLRTVLSIGGGSGSSAFPVLAATSAGRLNFARSAREWVLRHSFDGMDLDWEHPTTKEQGHLHLQLLQACRSVLPAPKYLLATALPVDPAVLRVLDLKSMAPLIDHINLMCYDFAGPWTSEAGHHAQLFAAIPSLKSAISGQAGLNYLVEHDVPPSRILLGIPVFARLFPGAQAPGNTYRQNGSELEIDYRDLPVIWKKDVHIDRKLGAAWYVDQEKGFASFDVPETVQMKAQFARTSGLGGIFFWTGAGDATGSGSLVTAGFDALHKHGSG